MQSACPSIILLALMPMSASATIYTTTPCSWFGYSEQEFEQVWYSRFFIASVVATAVCALTTLLASLPLCLGARKGMPLRIIAGVLALIAGCSMCLPMAMGIAHRVYYQREYCTRCYDWSCDEWYREAHFTFEDVASDYDQAFGFLVLVFGVATLVLSFITCCRCCGPLRERDAQKQNVSVVTDVA
mmetsp:Transcript_53683/g.153130  ORF Transcript_53683/g.153130 Transcript_53683/m.153130 type:complete len:186 (+) Transcript_53683:82-639(+)